MPWRLGIDEGGYGPSLGPFVRLPDSHFRELKSSNEAIVGGPDREASMEEKARAVWRTEHVVNVRDAAFAARTYIEHQDLRRILRSVAEPGTGSAAEIGAGYGRMTCVLNEFFANVTGFEREPHFVHEATLLFPAIRFVQVDTLERLPASDGQFLFILTFTVLQHLIDSAVAHVAKEIVRVLRPGGVLLTCELTDPIHRHGTVDNAHGMCTIGRTVDQYLKLFAGLKLRMTKPRRVEPTCPDADVGTYMLFVKGSRTNDTY